ncbi:MAG: LacI family DNA-binding transcriptional regulator [Oscillospiraceae bacterium]|nr:LacI family DNA-binding transcriptional regulator [Oscillospiraceae bacterium]
MKKATLKQIAEMAGVSTTTVHRALNGKGGCSRDVEEFICRIAQEQGYSTNQAAAALRKQPLQIAIIFPFRDNGGRFYIDKILDGYLEYRRELRDYNIVFQEFLLRSSDNKWVDYLDMEYPELERVLHQIYMEQPVRYDGVIIYGFSITRRAEALLNRIIGRGTKVVVMERRLPSLEDTCTVMADAEVGGNMAAEMLSKAIRNSGTVAVITQNVPGGDHCGDTCIRALQDERPDLHAVRLELIMNVDKGEEIARFLQEQENLVGVYITCGRHTKSTLDALEILGRKDLVVLGSELFAETYEALQNKVLSSVLDKRPQKIGYMALHLLLMALGKKRPMPEVYSIPPRIILRANSDLYHVNREYQHALDAYSD